MKHLQAEHWIALSFTAAVGVSAAVLMVAGSGEDGTRAALLTTARLAFLPFWLAYAGGALAPLFGPALQPVQRHARELGLAFAAIELVHLGLVAWLCHIGHAPSLRTFVIFGIAVLWVCLLTLFSIAWLHQRLGARGWWLMRLLGMNYLAYAFAIDFLRDPLAAGLSHALLYWPFAALAVVGPGLRLAAATQQLAKRSRLSPRAPAG